MKRVLILVTACFVFAAAAFAVPQIINYQGFLTNSDGSPLDTVVSMTFKLYTAKTSGTQLWTETQPSCTVRAGLFNTVLGTVTAVPDSFYRAQVWLGVTVGSNSEMVPRTRMISVPYAYRVGTVDGASGGSIAGKLNIGSPETNSNNGNISFVGGSHNLASGDRSAIVNGSSNQATGTMSFIGAGMMDTVSGHFSAIVSGNQNRVSGQSSFLGGGYQNVIESDYSATAAGLNNHLNGLYGFIGAGYGNNNQGTWSSIVGGDENELAGANSSLIGSGSGNYIYNSNNCGIVAGNKNQIFGQHNFIGAGSNNQVQGWRSAVVCGGGDSLADGNIINMTCDNSFIGSGKANRVFAPFGFIGSGFSNNISDSFSTVVGGAHNSAGGKLSFIGGGGSTTEGYGNWTNSDYAVVVGGNANTSTANFTAVVGGESNQASGLRAFIGGGFDNTASGQDATVGGGYQNIASGSTSTVPGGVGNEATGDFSTAMGFRAKANHIGAFVWADRTYADFLSTRDNQFNVRASGGVRMFTRSDTTLGAQLAPNATAWTALSDSTKKTDIRPVDTKRILENVAQLPISEWRYKAQPDPSVRHIGPMAQDFWNAFHLGEDSLGISTIDPDGIALAAIQELTKRNEKLEEELTQLRALVQTLMASQQKTMKEEK